MYDVRAALQWCWHAVFCKAASVLFFRNLTAPGHLQYIVMYYASSCHARCDVLVNCCCKSNATHVRIVLLHRDNAFATALSGKLSWLAVDSRHALQREERSRACDGRQRWNSFLVFYGRPSLRVLCWWWWWRSRASRVRFRYVGDTNAWRGRGIVAAWFGSFAWWFRRGQWENRRENPVGYIAATHANGRGGGIISYYSY